MTEPEPGPRQLVTITAPYESWRLLQALLRMDYTIPNEVAAWLIRQQPILNQDAIRARIAGILTEWGAHMEARLGRQQNWIKALQGPLPDMVVRPSAGQQAAAEAGGLRVQGGRAFDDDEEEVSPPCE
jgi:hypothetical protein